MTFPVGACRAPAAASGDEARGAPENGVRAFNAKFLGEVPEEQELEEQEEGEATEYGEAYFAIAKRLEKQVGACGVRCFGERRFVDVLYVWRRGVGRGGPSRLDVAWARAGMHT